MVLPGPTGAKSTVMSVHNSICVMNDDPIISWCFLLSEMCSKIELAIKREVPNGGSLRVSWRNAGGSLMP